MQIVRLAMIPQKTNPAIDLKTYTKKVSDTCSFRQKSRIKSHFTFLARDQIVV